MRCISRLLLAALFLLAAMQGPAALAEDHPAAPDFKGAVGWLNVSRPITMQELRGRVVLLDFWTYGCINCMHIIPDLKALERRFGDSLAVIGVHSAKFENEKETDNIRDIVLRYELEHPVINDANFTIWHAYGAEAWPTQVLIAPDGRIAAKFSGEGNFQRIAAAVDQLLKGRQKTPVLKPLPIQLERAKESPTALRFPGKVLADQDGNRIFIADTNNNRIIIARPDGDILWKVGSGVPGQADGDYQHASFFHPQGMALAEDRLYVADTENHLVRAIDLKSHMVSRVVGTGHQEADRTTGGPALTQALNSPWDLTFFGDDLFIAMAGDHQIWRLSQGSVTPAIGSGAEGRVDGGWRQAALAQPSGLRASGAFLYSADSESSSIRKISLGDSHAVTTVIGKGLFVFGDVDGPLDTAKLQHPLGIETDGQRIYVADTYNHRIKLLDQDTREIHSIAGTGKPGFKDGPAAQAQFNEPGGISLLGDKLYVADTNNHRIRVIALSQKTVESLVLH